MADDRVRCQYCIGWIPDVMISQHEDMCLSNPANEEFR